MTQLTKRSLTRLLLLLAVLVATGMSTPARAAVTNVQFVPVNNMGLLPNVITQDLFVEDDTRWLTAVINLDLLTGSVHQDVLGQDIQAPSAAIINAFPAVEFDSYVQSPDGAPALVLGNTVFSGNQVDITYGGTLGEVYAGTLNLGRFSLSNDASGTGTLTLGSIVVDQPFGVTVPLSIAAGELTAGAVPPVVAEFDSVGGVFDQRVSRLTVRGAGTDVRVIDPAQIEHRVRILETATVNLEGGRFGHAGSGSQTVQVDIEDRATLNQTGGQMRGQTFARNNSLVTIAGAAEAGRLTLINRASLEISGGNTIRAEGYDSSRLIVTGGTIEGETRPGGDAVGLAAFDQTQLMMSDGLNLGGIEGHQIAAIHLSGGEVRREVSLSESATLQMIGGRIRANADNFSDGFLVSEHARFFMTGGEITGDVLFRDDAEAMLSGGSLDSTIVAEDRTELSLSGQIQVAQLIMSDTAMLRLSGGRIGAGIRLGAALEINDHSIAMISGGVVQSDFALPFPSSLFPSGLHSEQSAQALIADGVIGDVLIEDQSLLVVGGGTLEHIRVMSTTPALMYSGSADELALNNQLGAIHYSGGSVETLDAISGAITVYGSNFNFPDGPIPDLTGNLTGTLFDGTPISVDFTRDDALGGQIILNSTDAPPTPPVIPEPGAVVFLGAASMLLLARKRAVW